MVIVINVMKPGKAAGPSEASAKMFFMQFGSMPGRKTTDVLFVVQKMQEEYRDKKKKLYICFVDIEKAFDRVPRKVMEWEGRKKGLLEL